MNQYCFFPIKATFWIKESQLFNFLFTSTFLIPSAFIWHFIIQCDSFKIRLQKQNTSTIKSSDLSRLVSEISSCINMFLFLMPNVILIYRFYNRYLLRYWLNLIQYLSSLDNLISVLAKLYFLEVLYQNRSCLYNSVVKNQKMDKKPATIY